jgi:hypothetical protein
LAQENGFLPAYLLSLMGLVISEAKLCALVQKSNKYDLTTVFDRFQSCGWGCKQVNN